MADGDNPRADVSPVQRGATGPSRRAWCFVSLPHEEADDIEARAGIQTAFGSVRVEVTVGATTWRTSLFPDTTQATYVLPMKQAVRAAEGLAPGDTCEVRLRIVEA